MRALIDGAKQKTEEGKKKFDFGVETSAHTAYKQAARRANWRHEKDVRRRKLQIRQKKAKTLINDPLLEPQLIQLLKNAELYTQENGKWPSLQGFMRRRFWRRISDTQPTQIEEMIAAIPSTQQALLKYARNVWKKLGNATKRKKTKTANKPGLVTSALMKERESTLAQLDALRSATNESSSTLNAKLTLRINQKHLPVSVANRIQTAINKKNKSNEQKSKEEAEREMRREHENIKREFLRVELDRKWVWTQNLKAQHEQLLSNVRFEILTALALQKKGKTYQLNNNGNDDDFMSVLGRPETPLQLVSFVLVEEIIKWFSWCVCPALGIFFGVCIAIYESTNMPMVITHLILHNALMICAATARIFQESAEESSDLVHNCMMASMMVHLVFNAYCYDLNPTVLPGLAIPAPPNITPASRLTSIRKTPPSNDRPDFLMMMDTDEMFVQRTTMSVLTIVFYALLEETVKAVCWWVFWPFGIICAGLMGAVEALWHGTSVTYHTLAHISLTVLPYPLSVILHTIHNLHQVRRYAWLSNTIEEFHSRIQAVLNRYVETWSDHVYFPRGPNPSNPIASTLWQNQFPQYVGQFYCTKSALEKGQEAGSAAEIASVGDPTQTKK